MKNIERVDRRLIHKGSILEIYEDTIKTIDGNIAKWDTLLHNGAAAVIPVCDDGKIIMVRQYRNPFDMDLLEIPAGGRNKSEDSLTCAMRELEEETGFRSDDIEYLITTGSAPAYCNELIDIYVAKNLKEGVQHFDRDEYLSLEYWNLDDLIEKIYKGELFDQKTVAGLLAYKDKYRK